MSNMKRDNITGKEITYYGEQPAAAGASYEQGLRYAGLLKCRTMHLRRLLLHTESTIQMPLFRAAAGASLKKTPAKAGWIASLVRHKLLVSEAVSTLSY
jgi:hypothetical protein